MFSYKHLHKLHTRHECLTTTEYSRLVQEQLSAGSYMEFKLAFLTINLFTITMALVFDVKLVGKLEQNDCNCKRNGCAM